MTAAGGAGRTIRVGIAGLGFGADVHLPAFRTIPGVDVIALLGTTSDRAKEIEKRTDLPVESDIGAWLDHKFDAVSVALPPPAIGGVVSAALERRLPVLCEKPLGKSAAEAERLARLADGIATGLDFQFPELETFSALKAAIDERAFGPIRHASVTWLTNSWAHRSGHWSWKTDADRGGGVLTLLGTHLLYLTEWLFGPVSALFARRDARVTERLFPSPGANAADDLLTLVIEHRHGPILTATVGNASPGISVHRWIVVGDRGTAVLENETRDYMAGFALRVLDENGKVVLSRTPPVGDGDGRLPPFRRLATRFIDAVRLGRDFQPSFDAGARVASLTDAVRESAAAGAWIPIQEGLKSARA